MWKQFKLIFLSFLFQNWTWTFWFSVKCIKHTHQTFQNYKVNCASSQKSKLELILYFLFIRNVLSAQLDCCKNVKLGHVKETERDPSPDISIDDQIITKELIDKLLKTGIECSNDLNAIAQWVVYSNEQIYHGFECFVFLQ